MDISKKAMGGLKKMGEGFKGATFGTEMFGTDVINAIGGQFGALPATLRQVVNPRIEFLYQATAPREFAYTFKMNARNQDESDDINEIVNAFKLWSHPQIKQGTRGNILRYPGEFEIEYMSYGRENDYLNKIANCVLIGVNVDYNTDGTFQTFRPNARGAAPVTVTMTLNFKEAEMLTANAISEGKY